MLTEDDLNNDYSCNCDNWLFHYTKHDTAIKYILPTLKLKTSYFGNMEDPFESASLQHSTWLGTPDDESKYTMHENTVNAYGRKQNLNKKITITNYFNEITDLVGIRILHIFKDQWKNTNLYIILF